MVSPLKNVRLEKNNILYLIAEDTGYSVICPRCSKRTVEKKELINKPRELALITCSICEMKKFNPKSWQYRVNYEV